MLGDEKTANTDVQNTDRKCVKFVLVMRPLHGNRRSLMQESPRTYALFSNLVFNHSNSTLAALQL